MEELVWIVNNEPVTDSRLIAKYFHKEHGKVLRKIRKLRSQGCTEGFFIESKFRCEQNHQMFTNYFVTYDGFSLLFNNKDPDETMMKFIEAFQKVEYEYDVPSCLIQPDDKRLKKWQKEENKRTELETRIAILEDLEVKNAPFLIFADALLNNSDAISLQELTWILSRKDKEARTLAMINCLLDKGYSLPEWGDNLPTDD